MELYTAQELEYLVVRRKCEEIRQKTQDKLFPALTRRLPVDNSGTNTLILINRGRWLLIASDFGSVSYYLDTRKPVKRPLILKKRERDGSFHVVNMAMDVDHESGLLSFNLALCLERGSGFYYYLEFQFQYRLYD